jgi:hypothetical protein
MHSRKKRHLISLAGLVVIVFSWAPSVFASGLSLHGFLQGNYSVNASDENPDGGDFKWAEERVQLKFEGNRDPYHLTIKTDVFYDHIEDASDIELREGYVDAVSGSWDMRLGRQIITWGIGDLIFINDVFPKDYEAFYAGRPMEYLKKGIDGLKVGLYPPAVNIDVVLIPFFEPNTFPRGELFHNSTNPEAGEPEVTLENTEAAFRAYRNIGGLDASLYFYKGFFRMPSMSSNGGFFYPELYVYGASIEGRAAGGIVGLEAGYYDSRQDRGGDNPSVPNSSSRLMLTYKRQLMEDFSIGLQYYIEYMQKYPRYETTLPAGYAKRDRLYQLTTMRLTRMLLHQNLTLSLFVFYSPSDGDYMLNPEGKYKFTDNIWAAVGANVFGGGKEWSQFGQLDKNDNMYLQARYEF